jgi:hypothetical protein
LHTFDNRRRTVAEQEVYSTWRRDCSETRYSDSGNARFGRCSKSRAGRDMAAWRWRILNRPLSAGCAGPGSVRRARKAVSPRLTTGGMMLVRRAVAAVALTLFAAGVLGTSATFAVAAGSAAPTAVIAEMGYNGVSPAEMGYN